MTYSATPAERRWCVETIVSIKDDLPSQYTLIAKARLEKNGIYLSRRYITDCKNLLRHDPRVVRVLEAMAKERMKPKAWPSKDEIRNKMK